MKTISKVLISVSLAVALPVVGLSGQQQITNKQERARHKFDELHARMQDLEITLAETEPEDSRVLNAGNRFIQEAEIRANMETVQKLLDEEDWDQALTEMDEVRRDLTKLMDLLLNRDTDLQALLEQIAEWEKFNERLTQLIDDQQAEKDAAARAEALEKHLKDLERASQKVEQIMAAQEALRADANQAGMAAAPEAAQEMAGQQGDLKEQTENLAAELEEIDKAEAELKGQEQAGGAGQPGEPKPGQPQPGQPGASGGSCSGSASSAAGSMGQSQQQLQQNKPESSLEDQDQALDKLAGLKKQLAEMSEEARRKLLSLPFDEQFKAQEQTRIDTDTLAQDMAKSESQDKSGEPTGAPGTQNVQQAVPKQKSAAGMLKERKPGSAKQKQQDAKEELEEAQRQLEEALAQLRQQLKDEVLRSLEERFGAMLAQQKELTKDTLSVDRLRQETLTAEGTLPASLAARCEEISDGESALASEAGSALQLLEEEGMSAVFPAMIGFLKGDLEAVAERLAEHKTGMTTQNNQKDIEEQLRDLINALRREIEESESEGAGQASDGQPPLVPMSAEVKLIKIMQERVHKRTVEYDTQVPEQLRITEEGRDEADEISRKQGQVEEVTRRLAEKLSKANKGGGK